MAVLAAAASPLAAELVHTDLTIPQASNALPITLSLTPPNLTTATQTKTTYISGNVLADFGMSFDPTTQALAGIDGMELTGGHFSATDTKFAFSWVFGLVKANIDMTGLGGTFDTPLPPGTVIGGSFDATQHVALFNQGTIVASATGQATQTIDLAAQPLPAPGSGSGTITVSPPTITGNAASYTLSLSMPVDMDQTIVDPAITARIQAHGTLQAQGQFSRPFTPAWNVDGGERWAVAGNWVGLVPDGAGASALLGERLTGAHAPASIKLDGDRRLGSLLLRNANSYNIIPGTGGSLLLDNGGAGASIEVAAGSHAIAAAVALVDRATITAADGTQLSLSGGIVGTGQDLAKRGAGVLKVRGGIILAAGTLDGEQGVLDADQVACGLLRIGEGARVSLSGEPDAHLTSEVTGLELAGAPGAWLATLDLNAGGLVIHADAADALDVLARVEDQVASARNASAGLWTGPGITSSSAQADPLSGLAVMLKADSSVVIQYGRNGDTDLNGVINGDDYGAIDAGFLSGQAQYAQGDFNYDSIIDGDDYALIDAAFLAQPGPSVAGQPVPEPGMAGVLVMSALLALRRTRRC